jgi:Ca2+-binding EF-hand superfamily protein
MEQNTKTPSRSWQWLAAVALVAGSVSVVAVAGPRGEHGQHGRHHASGIISAFERIDTDADGVVTRAEFDAHIAARQAALDGNADGSVSFEEAAAFRAAQREERARERFARLDTDGDGVVSTAEASAGQERIFTFLDRNDDGAVSEDELPRRRMRGE